MANAWILKPLPAAAVTTLGTVRTGAGTNLFNDYAGIICELACDSGGAAAVRIDLGGDTSLDTLFVFGLELVPVGTPVTISYATTAQGNFTGAFGVDASATAYAGAAAMTSGKGVTLWSLPAPVTARYVQITYAPTSSGQAVRMSRVAIGKRIALERNFSGVSFGVRDLGSLDFSPRGVLLRRRAAKLRTAALTFSNVRRYEVEAATKPLLEQIGNTEMVAIVTDPAADAQRQNRCYFGPLVGDLGQAWRKADLWEAKANIVSIF